MLFTRLRKSDGFTLIEVMAAMAIFTAVTLGITPLLLGSLRSATVGRTFTVAKNVVSRAMERARGLPYFESVKGITGTPPRRDLLDLYFPNVGTGYSGGVFTTRCTSISSTPAGSGPIACPPPNADGTSSIPPGYTLTIRAEFVSAIAGTNPTTFSVVTPPSTYDWTSLTGEVPPSDLVRLTAIGTWSYGRINKSFTLQSLIASRKLSEDELAGNATINFAAQVRTGYIDANAGQGTFRGAVGRSISDIEESAFAAADQEVRAAHLFLTEDPTGGTGAEDIITEFTGAQVSLHAAPNDLPTGQVNASGGSVVHPLLPGVTFGRVGTTHANHPMVPSRGVQVVNELPTARGSFRIDSGVGLELDNQKSFSDPLLVYPFAPVIDLESTGAEGGTAVTSTPVSPAASRKVEATAHIEFDDLHLYPTVFAPGGVVRVTDFVADIRCTSTGSATSSIAGTWSATIMYWTDNTSTFASSDYQSITVAGNIDGSGNAEADLDAIQSANPTVWFFNPPGPGPVEEYRLFSDPSTGLPGYLTDWSTTPFETTLTPGHTEVTLGSALTIEGIPTDPARPPTSTVTQVGSMSCESVDERG
ncbi:MAG TPA: type II secretion system protein [Actinomycetota bacterium]|nr:type II secretion system protein [Actinomycetota bacterium]